MDEKLYRELGQLTKDKSIWKQNIPYVASLLKNQSPKITAKAMWLLGEMGLIYPPEVAPYTKEIASFIVSENDLLRERTANALGRIGRADYKFVAPYFEELLTLARDKSPNVRLSFIWASENIATNTWAVYENIEMQNDKAVNVSEFVEKVRRYTEIKELTPAIVNEFIDYIMVSKKQVIDGKTVYPIDIYYNGIGIINAPSAEEYEEMFQERLKQKHLDKEKTA